MTLTFLLDLVGVGFLVAATFGANFPKVNSLGAGLSIIGLSHLIIPALV